MGCGRELTAERRRGRLAAVRRGLGAAFVAAGLLLAATMLVPAALGLERYVITGASMSGTYDRGALLYAEQVPVTSLRVGDVITYEPPAGAGPSGLVTHRIVEIRERAGGPVFRTAGDANAKPDPWRFRLDGPMQARAEFAIPYAGWAFAALSIREVRMLVIGLPALLVAVLLLAGLWRESGRAARGGGAPFPRREAGGRLP